MSVYKEERGTWRCLFRYKDYQGNVKQGQKRGFKTRREALEYEREFLAKSSFNNTMTFQSLYELYIEDMRSRLKENTILSKKHIIEVKILPFFQKLTLDKITPVTIRKWQNGLLEYKNKTGESYSQTYIKSINNQLVAIFNYAVKYHSMKENPCHKAGNIGKKHADEMKIWTVEEFNKFIYELKHKPVQYTGFNILFWCGLRIGDDDDKIRLNQRKPSKYKGLSRFGPEKNLQRINKFMKERPTFYKKLIQMKENFRFYLRCFYCITKVVILQFNSEKQDRISS